MLRASTSRPRSTGFTLIELMFVVVIIGVLAAAVAPELNRSRTDAEVANAASALVRLGSRARAHAAFTGLAHVLAWMPVNGNGSIQLFRLDNARCNSMSAAAVWTNPIDQVNADATVYRASVQLQLVPSAGTPANVQICIQPNGTTLLRTAFGAPFTDFLGGISDVSFDLFQQRGGTRVGALRQVVFPNGNLPRWAQ